MKNEGFTLPELLLTGSIFALIVAGVAGFAVLYFGNYSFSFEENQAINVAQTAITNMSAELREARSSTEGAWPLVLTEDTALTFYSDITDDGLTDRVRYFMDGTDLRKGIIEPATAPPFYRPEDEYYRTVATNVDTSSGPIFTYYNDDWPSDVVNNPLQGTTRSAATRYISIKLRIDLSPGASAPPFELTGGVQLRGLKDNL